MLRFSVAVDETGHAAVGGKLRRQTTRGDERGGKGAFANLHVPEPEQRFGLRVVLTLGRRGFLHGRQRFLFVAAAEHPRSSPRHPRIDDVLDPGAGDLSAQVVWIAGEERVERMAGLPEFIPPGLAAERAE